MVSFDTPAASASSRSVSTCSVRRVLSLSTFTSMSGVVQDPYFMRKLYRQLLYIARRNTDKYGTIRLSDKGMAPAVLEAPRGPAHKEIAYGHNQCSVRAVQDRGRFVPHPRQQARGLPHGDSRSRLRGRSRGPRFRLRPLLR